MAIEPTARIRYAFPASARSSGIVRSGFADSIPTTSSPYPGPSARSSRSSSVAPAPRLAKYSSEEPKSWTNPSSTSAMVGPLATAMLSEWEGSMRRAFSEPSSGSTITKVFPASSPNGTSPRSSEIAMNPWPSACNRSSSAKTMSSQRRSMASVRSPPSPIPSYAVRAAIPGLASNSSRWAVTMRRKAASQSAPRAPRPAGVGWAWGVCLRDIAAMLDGGFAHAGRSRRASPAQLALA